MTPRETTAGAARADDAAESWSVSAWGSTAAERAQPFPCDALVDAPNAAYFRAVDVEAPPAVVFRWLCQLRAAPYSYDWIDNFGRTSPRELTPGLEQLVRGQRVMRIFTLADFTIDRHLTLVLTDTGSRGLFGELAVTYAVHAGLRARSRIVVKLAIRYPPAPVGWVMRALLPLGDLIMMRQQLLTLKSLAETTARR